MEKQKKEIVFTPSVDTVETTPVETVPETNMQ
jgi:hypothetical protein